MHSEWFSRAEVETMMRDGDITDAQSIAAWALFLLSEREENAVTAALITGASTGIGRELASLFAADGVDVIVVSSERSAAELTALAEELRSRHGVRVDAITMDLSKAGAGAELVARVDELGVDVEYLVNNAGVGILGLKARTVIPRRYRRWSS